MSVTVSIETRCSNMIEHVKAQAWAGARLPRCEHCRSVRITTVVEELPHWQPPTIQFDSTIDTSRTRDKGESTS